MNAVLNLRGVKFATFLLFDRIIIVNKTQFHSFFPRFSGFTVSFIIQVDLVS